MPRVSTAEISRTQPVLVLAVTVLILYFARDLLIPLTFALTLSFLLAPAVSRLESRRVPRVLAVALTCIVAFIGIFSVGYVVSRQLLNVANDLPAYRLNIQRKLATVHSPAEQSLEKAFNAVEGISGDITTTAPPTATQAPTQVQPVRIIDPDRTQLQTTAELLMRFLRPIGTVGVVIVFSIYLLMKREELRHRILLLAGMGRINLMTQALQEAATRISQYLVFQLAVNAAYGILFGGGLYLIGVPDATLWGALAGILRIVPYVGTATSLALPLIVSVAISTTWWPPILILGLFLALELTATNFVEPWLYSTRTGISSLALLAMAIFWALLWGWPGLILSTPLTVCIVVMGRHVPQLSFLHTLLGTDAELSAEALFYERLLAMDQQEARAVANRFLDGKPLVELYDSVLIPALALVEQDRHQGNLDDKRSDFFFLTIGEIVAELTDYHQKQPADTSPATPKRISRQIENDFAVVCISVSDQADELTTLMLGQLMERASHPTLLLSAASVAGEILDSLAAEPTTVVFISALPPFAFSQARAICQRVRSHLPNNRIIVGLWNSPNDPDQTPEQLIERFGSGKPNIIVTSLAQALQQLTNWHRQQSSQFMRF
ncbi:AI-2E family transporter [Tunturiibacter gelidoferens]|jgi:predicted PurR-regulated permease PerM|uniref:PurR-regulated permease PerM n=1 Tax=Tunturiibacter gelidiferens TaxID=3069689 RepID=A0A9X0QBM8_9BACT|nr:AI-2E family transporter [Edaphobacter lichenicola]MBB5327389.1 putative PurR-regulated permease PerM [Edaphobacter lichenicola]